MTWHDPLVVASFSARSGILAGDCQRVVVAVDYPAWVVLPHRIVLVVGDVGSGGVRQHTGVVTAALSVVARPVDGLAAGQLAHKEGVGGCYESSGVTAIVGGGGVRQQVGEFVFTIPVVVGAGCWSGSA